MGTEKARKRPTRSVTIDPDVVTHALRVGGEMIPKEENLSRLIDRALAEFIERHDRKKSKPRG